MERLDHAKPTEHQEWQNFLQQQGITNFAASEVAVLKETLVWRCQHDGRIIATVSLAPNLIKYMAIDPEYRADGKFFNQVVTAIMNVAANAGMFLLRVATKPQYVTAFEHVGFNLLAQTETGALLETGPGGISHFIAQTKVTTSAHDIAAIVMNANPCTLGHLALITAASKQHELVYVFVVQQEASAFTFEERLALVKANTKHLANVVVKPGGAYMVSYTTFPAYFVADTSKIATYQATLDATLFKHQIARPLNITTRYVGTEPYSPTTNAYNQALNAVLPPEVAVVEVDRVKNQHGDIVSATKVRAAIAADDQALAVQFLPPATAAFVTAHWQELRRRPQIAQIAQERKSLS